MNLLDLQKMEVSAAFNNEVSPYGSCVFNSCNGPTPIS